ncbi:MAG: 2-oxoglutarate dehydrogenase complex dihydrolipoyllysine-residue succinyltransferase [Alphaproteobacteria bacterium]|nr:2-oxoglutarate dehydrogenase complex dihydrolipoyllysine-residue succinyltransferase [Alphaproteobacteria bacterium]
MTEIKVPILGESISDGTISKWVKKIGDFVKADEMIAEIETDKITMEINAPSSGVLKEIRVLQGDNAEVGSVIAVLDDSAKEPVSLRESPSVPPKAVEQSKEKILSPAAQKISQEKNINLQEIFGTGKDGRITKEDVLNTPFPTVNTSGKEERVRMTRLRQRIAERLKSSQNTAALLTTFNEVDMSNVMAMRDRYKDRFFEKHGVKLGFMSFFVRSVVETLKEIPDLNAEIDGQDILYKNYYNIGVAVGTEQGLVVPVLKNAEYLDLSQIESSIAGYASKARNNTLSLDDLSGGTFTISNGGVYGSLLSTPIVNPPQSGILGLHKIQQRPVVVDNQIVIRPMMYLALTYDHRIVDGKGAVTFLAKVKERIETPETLLLNI